MDTHRHRFIWQADYRTRHNHSIWLSGTRSSVGKTALYLDIFREGFYRNNRRTVSIESALYTLFAPKKLGKRVGLLDGRDDLFIASEKRSDINEHAIFIFVGNLESLEHRVDEVTVK